jgi:diadenosine tetraphosphate (Ap4A) HIT family hydrolase
MEQADDSSVVFRDEMWAAQIAPGLEVPGWIVLRARRHVERLTGLNNAESDSFGRRARDLAAALTEVTGAPATYLMTFCENHAHFHALITARGAAIPAKRRSAEILKLVAEQADPEAAARLVPAISQAYQLRARSDLTALDTR